jgi:hypothetical protein
MPPSIALTLLIIGVVATAYTLALYTKGNKGWFKSEIGQLLISMSGAVGALYLWSLIVRLFPSIPGSVRTVVINALFLIITGTIVWRAVIMTKLYIIARSERKDEDSVKSETD